MFVGGKSGVQIIFSISNHNINNINSRG